MKFYSVVKDKAGHFHRSMTRAPDLFRREISAATGAGTLLYCSMLPQGVGARDLDRHLHGEFASAQIEGRTVLIGNDQAILAAIHHVTTVMPRRLVRYRRAKRLLKGLMLAFPASLSQS